MRQQKPKQPSALDLYIQQIIRENDGKKKIERLSDYQLDKLAEAIKQRRKSNIPPENMDPDFESLYLELKNSYHLENSSEYENEELYYLIHEVVSCVMYETKQWMEVLGVKEEKKEHSTVYYIDADEYDTVREDYVGYFTHEQRQEITRLASNLIASVISHCISSNGTLYCDPLEIEEACKEGFVRALNNYSPDTVKCSFVTYASAAMKNRCSDDVWKKNASKKRSAELQSLDVMIEEDGTKADALFAKADDSDSLEDMVGDTDSQEKRVLFIDEIFDFMRKESSNRSVAELKINILKMRFGLNGTAPMSILEIANALNKQHSYVRSSFIRAKQDFAQACKELGYTLDFLLENNFL